MHTLPAYFCKKKDRKDKPETNGIDYLLIMSQNSVEELSSGRSDAEDVFFYYTFYFGTMLMFYIFKVK